MVGTLRIMSGAGAPPLPVMVGTLLIMSGSGSPPLPVMAPPLPVMAGLRQANIVIGVKKCYKRFSRFRMYGCRKYGMICHERHCYYGRKWGKTAFSYVFSPPKRFFSPHKMAVLNCKSGTLERLKCHFCIVSHCTLEVQTPPSGWRTALSACTRKIAKNTTKGLPLRTEGNFGQEERQISDKKQPAIKPIDITEELLHALSYCWRRRWRTCSIMVVSSATVVARSMAMRVWRKSGMPLKTGEAAM